MSGAAEVTEVTIKVCSGGVLSERTYLELNGKAALKFLARSLVDAGLDQRELAVEILYLGVEMMPKPKPVLNEDGTLKNFMIKGADRSFRCVCGGNVFHKPDDARPSMYRCNSCEEDYDSK
jgi:hypothetical protein